MRPPAPESGDPPAPPPHPLPAAAVLNQRRLHLGDEVSLGNEAAEAGMHARPHPAVHQAAPAQG